MFASLVLGENSFRLVEGCVLLWPPDREQREGDWRGWGARVSFLQQNRHLGADSGDASVNNSIDSNFQEPGFPQVRSFLLRKAENHLLRLTLAKLKP